MLESRRYGTIVCECGQEFYFETYNPKVNCVTCNKEYDVSSYPIKQEVTQYGTDIGTSDDSQ